MSQGSLIFPLWYMPLDDSGNPVPSGKLYFYRSTTTTAQDTYSDSTLLSANANPVVLNSAGRLATKVYGNPASGFDYGIVLKTSADVTVVPQIDDVVVDGADTATFASGSFTGTITGTASATTGTITYKVFANSAGTGKLCVLHAASSILGVSNTTAMTMTGLPAAVQPTTAVFITCTVRDNSVDVPGAAEITAASSTITFYCDPTLSATGFTAANNKGVLGGFTLVYAL